MNGMNSDERGCGKPVQENENFIWFGMNDLGSRVGWKWEIVCFASVGWIYG